MRYAAGQVLPEVSGYEEGRNFLLNPINETQRKYIFCPKRFSCWDGGVWTGKTSGMVIKAHLLSSMFPGNRGAIFRYTEEDLSRTVYKTFKDLVPLAFYDPKNGGKDNAGYTRYVNGSEILWMHLKDLNIKALMSLELGWFGIGQAEECQASAYEMLETRMRFRPKGWPKDEYFPQYGMIECNPNGKDWIYYKFHPDVCQDTENYAYFFTTTAENGEELKKANPDYYRTLMSKPESWKRRFFYGSREISEGAWHKNFQKRIHCYDPQKFNPFDRMKVRAIVGLFDYGVSAESSMVWMAIDSERNRWFFKELYGVKNTIADHARAILRMESGFPNRVATRLADPSIFFNTRKDSEIAALTGNQSVSDEYAMNGVYFVPADNSQQEGFEHIEEGLMVRDNRTHPVTMEHGAPQFFFSMECENTVAQMMNQRKKLKRNPLSGEMEYSDERSLEVEDHAYDCVLYGANWNSASYQTYNGPMPRPAMRYADYSKRGFRLRDQR